MSKHNRERKLLYKLNLKGRKDLEGEKLAAEITKRLQQIGQLPMTAGVRTERNVQPSREVSDNRIVIRGE